MKIKKKKEKREKFQRRTLTINKLNKIKLKFHHFI
jgi:hypothetical protein